MQIKLSMAAYVLFVPSSWATTLIVDDDDPANYSEIQAAILNATEGDTIVVEPGSYAGFVLEESVRIIGRSNNEVHVQGDVQIGNVGGTQFAMISSVNIAGHTTLLSNTAPVLIHDVVSSKGINILESDFVLLDNVEAVGEPGLNLDASTLWLVDSSIQGRTGASGFLDCFNIDKDGSDALVGIDSEIYVANSQIAGGGAGFCSSVFSTTSGDSGQGARLGGDSSMKAVGPDTTITSPPILFGDFGTPGTGLVLDHQSVALIGGGPSVSSYLVNDEAQLINSDDTYPILELNGTTFSIGQTATLKFVGPDGAIANSYASSELSSVTTLENVDGAIILDEPLSFLGGTQVSTTGRSSIHLVIPSGVTAASVIILQSALIDGSGVAISNPQILTTAF